jgi:hypothetical protein
MLVWDDIERFLHNPGDILEELTREREMEAGLAIAEAELVTLEAALEQLSQRRKKAIQLNLRDLISESELAELLVEIVREQEGIEERLKELQADLAQPVEPPSPDLLEELRRRLDEGLTETQRQEIVQLLVKGITVHTDVTIEGKKVRVLIEYRFPAVVNVNAGTGFGRQPA